MKKKLKNFMGILMGCSFGAYLGMVLAVWLDYKKNPGLYELYSAPWYTRMIVPTIIVGIFLVIEGIIYGYLWYTLKKGKK